jgi:sensor histidine kinase YesM
MNQTNKSRPLGARLLRLLVFNILVAVAVALIWYWAKARNDHGHLSSLITSSLIHSMIYGLMFGLLMPYIAERLKPIRRPWNWIWILISLALVAVSSSLLVQISLFSFRYIGASTLWPEFGYKSATVFLIAVVIALSIHIYEAIQERIQCTNLQLRAHELEKERALKLATEARLASLESRLHPHFLFNTLNTISALILEDPLLADQMVQRLAALLRTSLYASPQTRVPLRDEIELIRNYLEIERARFRERLAYEIDIEPELESVVIPPLTLQPLVENSVKFAVSPRIAGGAITVSARQQTGMLTLEVRDNGPGFTAEMIPKDHGLDNLRSRLEALFGDDARLAVASDENSTSVSVVLPLNGRHG